MFTEETARDKWCPFARGTNRCVASDCMAWRWVQTLNEHKIEAIKRHRNETGSSLIDAKTFVEAHPEYMRVSDPLTGYCGLAGIAQPPIVG